MKDGDKANSLTKPPNDTIISTETRPLITASTIPPVVKDPSCWLLVRASARQTGALPTELTVLRTYTNTQNTHHNFEELLEAICHWKE